MYGLHRMHSNSLLRIQNDQAEMTIMRPVSEKRTFPFLRKHEWDLMRVRVCPKHSEMRNE